MLRTLRFHLDENVDPAVALGLRKHGIDVTTSGDVGLLAAIDQEQLAFASAESRVLVTHDPDFIVLHGTEQAHSGILFCRQRKYSIGGLIRAVVEVWECLEPADLGNGLYYL